MKIFFLVLSTLLPLISPYIYARAILKGESSPHRTTRFVYLIIGLLTTFSLLASGNMVALCISGVSLIQSVILFFLSINYGVGGWEKTSIVCLICALLGIAAWQFSSNPFIGLYTGIVADFFGSIPTIIKTIRDPKSEVPLFYATDSLAGIFNIFASTSLTIESLSFPMYLVIINGVIATLALRNKPTTTIVV